MATRYEQSRPRAGWLAAAHRALIGWAFRRFYREFAWTYDVVAWLVSRGLWYRWGAAGLPYLRGRTLELGCGTGRLQSLLAAERPGAAIGLDLSAQMLAQTRQRAARQGQHVRLVRAAAEQLPFATGSFGAVLATFPTEYILQRATLAEVRRVLATDGRLVIVDAAALTDAGWYAGLVALAYRLVLLTDTRATRPEQRPDNGPQTPASPVPRRRHIYEAVLEQAGFTVEVASVSVAASSVLVFVAQPCASAGGTAS